MIVDPFLQAHLAHPLLYDLGSRLTPFSVRDQMVRAAIVVDRAVESGQVVGTERPLLVIGAGVSGVTAALRAAGRYHVQTTLIDSSRVPFSIFARCNTRRIDPTEFDWPLAHWREERFPWEDPKDMPFGEWQANQTSILVGIWNRILTRSMAQWSGPRSRVSRLQFRGRTAPVPGSYRVVGDKVELNLADVDPSQGLIPPGISESFGLVLSCTGAGAENTSVPSGAHSPHVYVGPKYWQNDEFATDDLGFGARGISQAPRVIIAGGGDGALQDYLRLLSRGRTAKTIFQSLNDAVGGRLDEFALEVMTHEDRALRAFVWSNTENWQHDHIVHAWLDNKHRNVVLRALALDGLRDAIDDLLGPQVRRVVLAHWCGHFDRCYGLNRFLVHLFAQHLEHHPDRRRRGKTIRPGTSIVAVQGEAHVCDDPAVTEDDRPYVCHGQSHVVSLADCPECRMSSIGRSVSRARFNVVVVRYGPLARAPWYVPSAAPNTVVKIPSRRHLLPYSVPC